MGAADGEVGGDTLLLGFLTAGDSTISKDLPASEISIWALLGTRQDTDQEGKWGNGWVIKDKSTSACVQQLFGGGLDFSHFFLASLGNEGEFQKLDARRYQSANLAEISSTSYTWGRGSSTSRSPALSALAGEVTKVVGGVPEAGLLESPTWGWF